MTVHVNRYRNIIGLSIRALDRGIFPFMVSEYCTKYRYALMFQFVTCDTLEVYFLLLRFFRSEIRINTLIIITHYDKYTFFLYLYKLKT